MQGRLRNEDLSIRVQSECACCRAPLEIQIDSDLNYAVRTAGADPMAFVPDLDLATLDAPSIIDGF